MLVTVRSRKPLSVGASGSLAEFLGFTDTVEAPQAYAHVAKGGLDLHGADSVGAVEKVAPGVPGAIHVALAEVDTS